MSPLPASCRRILPAGFLRDLRQQLANGGHDVLKLHRNAGIANRFHRLRNTFERRQNLGVRAGTEGREELTGITSERGSQAAQSILANIAAAHANPTQVQRGRWQVNEFAWDTLGRNTWENRSSMRVDNPSAKSLQQGIEYPVELLSQLINNVRRRFYVNVDVLQVCVVEDFSYPLP
jgi:hypothetical protein